MIRQSNPVSQVLGVPRILYNNYRSSVLYYKKFGQPSFPFSITFLRDSFQTHTQILEDLTWSSTRHNELIIPQSSMKLSVLTVYCGTVTV